MMDDKTPCKRCGAPTPTYDFERDSTFWAAFQRETVTTVTRRIRILNHYWRRNPGPGSEHLEADDRHALCAGCSGLLVGRFMQGRAVPAIEGKEGQ